MTKKAIYFIFYFKSLVLKTPKTSSATKQKTCFPCIFKPFDFLSTGNNEKAEAIILPESYIHVNSVMGT